MKIPSVAYNPIPIKFAPIVIENETLTKEKNKIKYQTIAPSPVTTILGMNNINTQNFIRKKYTPHSHGSSYNMDQTKSIQRRNARERNRVKQVNNSFAKLRQHIPQSIIADLTKGGGRGPNKKISKVDTLRIAVEYIRRLHDLVEELNSNCSGSEYERNNSYVNTECGRITPRIHHSEERSKFSQESQQKSFTALPNIPSEYSSPSSSVGCLSPTSSFKSNVSFDSGTYEPVQHIPGSAAINAHLQLKYEPYDSFAINENNAADEEILDYISLWQEQ